MNKQKAKNNIFNKTNGFFEKTDNFLLKNVGPYVLGFDLFKIRKNSRTRNFWKS